MVHRLWELRSEEHTSELQSQSNLVCRLLLEKKKKKYIKCVVHRAGVQLSPAGPCLHISIRLYRHINATGIIRETGVPLNRIEGGLLGLTHRAEPLQWQTWKAISYDYINDLALLRRIEIMTIMKLHNMKVSLYHAINPLYQNKAIHSYFFFF